MVQLFTKPPKKEVLPDIPQDRPVYRILNEQGFYAPNDRLYQAGEFVALWDVPNEDMEPMNELAREALDKYIDTLEASAKLVAEKNGRAYSGRPRSKEEMIDAANIDARRAQTVGMGDKGVPIMGAKINSKKRVQNIGEVETPMMSSTDEARLSRVSDI